jgi:hypothetical protein
MGAGSRHARPPREEPDARIGRRAETTRRPAIERWAIAFCLASGLLVVPNQSAAHHSFAMFDFSKVVTFHATVREFQWTNPHVILTFAVDATDGGEPQTWWAELTSPGNLTRVGWSKRAFKAGDLVEITLHPLRDGTHGGAFTKATLLDTGHVWTSDLRAQEKPELGVADPSDGGSSALSGGGDGVEHRMFRCSLSTAPVTRDGGATVVLLGALALLGARRRLGRGSP